MSSACYTRQIFSLFEYLPLGEMLVYINILFVNKTNLILIYKSKNYATRRDFPWRNFKISAFVRGLLRRQNFSCGVYTRIVFYSPSNITLTVEFLLMVFNLILNEAAAAAVELNSSKLPGRLTVCLNASEENNLSNILLHDASNLN